MSIRELSENDLESLLELYSHLHEKGDTQPPPDVAISVWDTIQGNESIKYYGAFAGKRLVSTCNITVIPNLTRGCKSYGLIENVVTHKQYRRQGLGQAVLEAALEFAWGNNCYKVMLMTGRQDEGTYHFYESAGFIRNEKEAFIAKPTAQ